MCQTGNTSESLFPLITSSTIFLSPMCILLIQHFISGQCFCANYLALSSKFIHVQFAAWQNKVVSLDPFCPKEVTVQDQETGVCILSQFPTQAVQMVSPDPPSQIAHQSQDLRTTSAQGVCSKNCSPSNPSNAAGKSDNLISEAKMSSFNKKRTRIAEDRGKTDLSLEVQLRRSVCTTNSSGHNIQKLENSHVGPDVAAAIEDLLEQTSKVNA